MRMSVRLDTIVSLAKRRGFVFQASEIYGGFESTWDYGPLGVELKRRIADAWWRDTVLAREDVVGLDSAILQAPRVWEVSGQLAVSISVACPCPCACPSLLELTETLCRALR